MSRSVCSLTFCFAILAASTTWGEVAAYEKEIVIPTWEAGPPQAHPVYLPGEARIYPYTMRDVLTDHKVDKTYRAVFLENEYVQIMILPELGGRLHGARDKTNGYAWFYTQPTIKPGLIAMTGAWISGGIEWNFPHGHRPSCLAPVDCRIVKHEDGSATVWVGETELVYRLRWSVGLTLRPGRSHLRCDYVLVNPTNQRHSFECWATSATHANADAQVFLPGDLVTGHSKREFWHWPVNHGVDITWWKNSPNASSYFAFANPSDWFAAYDHKARGGMVHVADHRTMPGKKIWTWGSGPSGRIWEDILSEGGGPYFEPQAGAFSDNQPDYHWLEPNEVKTVHDYWYPIRDSGGVRRANQDFAVNLELSGGEAHAAVCATGAFPDCQVVLRNARSGAVLSKTAASIAPDKPCDVRAKVPAELTPYDLHLAVYDAHGKLRVEFQQEKPKQVELPPGQNDPGDAEKMTSDELYHAGEWLDRFRRTDEALVYYRKALKRDPLDTRVNIELGFLALKQGLWREGLDRLSAARKRNEDDARVYYGCGIAYLGLNDVAAAYDAFSRASYSPALFAAAYHNLARIDLRRGELRGALVKLDEAAQRNGRFADLPALQAAVLRRLGRLDDAQQAAREALHLEPLHFMGAYEKMLSGDGDTPAALVWKKTWKALMRDDVQNYLELAVAYGDAGLFDDADGVLALFSAGKEDRQVHPMVNYFRGSIREAQGDLAAADEYYAKAAHGPVDYTLPHRLEAVAALEAVLHRHPEDAHAHLFSGDLLYAKERHAEALVQWKAAVERDGRLAHAWRNIGYDCARRGDFPAACTAYEKCLQINPRDALAMREYDQAAETATDRAAGRLAFLQQHYDVVATRDDLRARLVDLLLLTGDPEHGDPKNLKQAQRELAEHHFHSWEGKYDIHLCWMEVNQALGDRAMRGGDLPAALGYYQEACKYPKNLEVAAPTPDFRAALDWNLYSVTAAMKKPEAARDYLQQIVAEKYSRPHLGSILQSRAQKALGNRDASRALLESLEGRARKLIAGQEKLGAKEQRRRGPLEALGHYLLAQVLKERGDDRWKAEAATAVKQDPRVARWAIRDAQAGLAR